MRRTRDSCAAATRNMGHTDRLCHAMCESFVASRWDCQNITPARWKPQAIEIPIAQRWPTASI